MKKILCALPGLAMLLALAGCCANDVCNCDDKLADALQFKVNYTIHRQVSGGRFISFNASDIDTIRIYRTSRNVNNVSNFVPTTDSVTLNRPLAVVQTDTTIAQTVQTTSTTGVVSTLTGQDIVVINNAAPFTSSSSTAKLNYYDYRIALIRNRAKNRQPTYSYYITAIKLAGNYTSTGCCSCYQNTRKTFALGMGSPTDTMRVVVTDSTQPVRLRHAN